MHMYYLHRQALYIVRRLPYNVVYACYSTPVMHPMCHSFDPRIKYMELNPPFFSLSHVTDKSHFFDEEKKRVKIVFQNTWKVLD